MLDPQFREMKIHFSEQFNALLKPTNDGISSRKAELQLKNKAIDKLASEMESVKSNAKGFESKKIEKRDIYPLCSKWDDSEFLVWN